MTPLDALRKVAEARPAIAADAVDGVMPTHVAAPASVEEAADVMRVAAEHGMRVVPRGAGTKTDWGAPPSDVDLVIDTSRLDRIVEHAAGDLVVKVQAGAAMARVQDALSAHGQQLALDEPVPGSTVGGTLATATSGPRRLLYGTPRDLLIGVTVIRADGTTAHSGGKVVKNVAGYDLGKLFTGSYGTLGLIAEAAFRLHPLAPASQVVTWTANDARAAHEGVQAVVGSQLVPAAVEVDLPEPGAAITLAVLFEGIAEAVEARAEKAARLLGAGSRSDRRPPPWWGRHPAGPDGVLIKVAAEISALSRVLGAVDRAATEAGVSPAVRGSAGTGVLQVGLAPTTDGRAAATFVIELRRALGPDDASAVVLHAPRAVRAAVDVWGPVRALALMRRVKDQFDPEHRLAPGRFVGGI